MNADESTFGKLIMAITALPTTTVATVIGDHNSNIDTNNSSSNNRN